MSLLVKRTALKKIQLLNCFAHIIVLDMCPSRSCKKWPNEVQRSCMFCLSVLQGNKETLAIKIGKELAK